MSYCWFRALLLYMLCRRHLQTTGVVVILEDFRAECPWNRTKKWQPLWPSAMAKTISLPQSACLMVAPCLRANSPADFWLQHSIHLVSGVDKRMYAGFKIFSKAIYFYSFHSYFCHLLCGQTSATPQMPLRRNYPKMCTIFPIYTVDSFSPVMPARITGIAINTFIFRHCWTTN